MLLKSFDETFGHTFFFGPCHLSFDLDFDLRVLALDDGEDPACLLAVCKVRLFAESLRHVTCVCGSFQAGQAWEL